MDEHTMFVRNFWAGCAALVLIVALFVGLAVSLNNNNNDVQRKRYEVCGALPTAQDRINCINGPITNYQSAYPTRGTTP